MPRSQTANSFVGVISSGTPFLPLLFNFGRPKSSPLTDTWEDLGLTVMWQEEGRNGWLRGPTCEKKGYLSQIRQQAEQAVAKRPLTVSGMEGSARPDRS